MGDMADDFRALREHNRERRQAAQRTVAAAILALEQHGFTVRQLTDRLDLFPVRRRYHDTKTGRRGGYQDPKTVAEIILREREKRT
jgi:hypothetical protein